MKKQCLKDSVTEKWAEYEYEIHRRGILKGKYTYGNVHNLASNEGNANTS